MTEERRELLLDTFKVVHWMNARKITGPELAARLAIDEDELCQLLARDELDVTDELAELLAKQLEIELPQISADTRQNLVVIRTAADMRAMSLGPSSRSPSTEADTGRQAPCDIGATKAAIDGSGAASHSPQP